MSLKRCLPDFNGPTNDDDDDDDDGVAVVVVGSGSLLGVSPVILKCVSPSCLSIMFMRFIFRRRNMIRKNYDTSGQLSACKLRFKILNIFTIFVQIEKYSRVLFFYYFTIYNNPLGTYKVLSF